MKKRSAVKIAGSFFVCPVPTLLKRGGIVTSDKGAQGGYLRSRMPGKIIAFDVLSAVESSLKSFICK